MTPSKLFCFGLGYSARRFALGLIADGWQVAGTVRDADAIDELTALGIEAVVFDPNHPLEDLSERLDGVSHILSSVPPTAEGDAVLDCHGADLDEEVTWVGYLSTTGVYGNRNGGTVREGDPLEPTSARARNRVAAEKRWLERGAHAFRLAGIYGPGRNVLEDVRNGRAKRIDKPNHVFSRIHVDDIANVLKRSMARPNPGAAYNVCDDEAAQPMDVISYACDLLDVVPPPIQPFAEAEKEMSAMGRTFWNDNKRVDNTRIKQELGVELLYPTYREGLQMVLEQVRI